MIKHLSPSSLCLFRSQPRIWVGKYLDGWKDEAGPKAWRGTAIEVGLDHVLHGGTVEVALGNALERFEEDAQGDLSDAVAKQRALIGPMLKMAVNAAGNLGYPLSYQKKIELQLGVAWPLTGWLDWRYEPFVLDLKSTERLPSAIKPDGTLEKPKSDHRMQVSLYAEAEKTQGRLLYVTDKRAGWYHITPEEQDADIAEARQLADSISLVMEILEKYGIAAVRRLYPMDPDNFRWSDSLRQLYLQEQAA